MARRIRFEFSLEKFAAAMAYLADVGKIHDLTKLKAAKLLFFADKAHLLRHGRPILGDRYVSMDHGPVPSAALDLMNRLIAPDEIEDPVREELRTKLSVHRNPFAKNHPFRTKVHGEAAYRHLSASERAVLDDIIATYGRKPIGALIELTHQEYAWRESDKFRSHGSCAPMPYELFFEGEHTAEANALREFAEAQQEDRDFLCRVIAMNKPATAGNEFEQRLYRGAVLRLTLDKTTLDDPEIDERSKYVIVVSALLPDDDVWFVICTSKSDHFDKNTQFANDILIFDLIPST